jgi:DNA repair protein RecO (recombination protein O)
LSTEVDYPRAVALGHIAEMLDELLPDREANDTVFRLAWSVLQNLPPANIWMPITYFDLWMVRLMGFMPELDRCIVCDRPLDGQRAYFHALVDGLMCPQDKRLASSEMSPESRKLAAQMFRMPIERFGEEQWPRSRGADIRKLCREIVERHIERKLVTSVQLERL